jgi:hypothetical protein
VLPKYPEPALSREGPDTFLDAVACWLDPRRLVTTEVFVRRPDFQPVWVSIGLDLVAGTAVATVREAVIQAITQFLSPLPDPNAPPTDALASLSDVTRVNKGWPLSKPVVALELVAVASRVPGVAFVKQVILADVEGKEYDQIPMVGLELPELAGLSVAIGEAVPISSLRGTTTTGTSPGGGTGGTPQRPPVVPVPIIPEEC